MAGTKRRSGASEYAVVATLMAQAAETDDAGRKSRLREQAIAAAMPLADHVARRFSGRGEPFDDLLQVAHVGLVNAVDRFDPERGSDFLSFAVPTIMGEVRRHFRDNTWSIRVSRRAKDTAQAIARGIDELVQTLGRSPRPTELAAHLDLPLTEVIDGLLARSAHSATSIDQASTSDGGEGRPLVETLGTDDPDMERVADSVTIRPLLERLPARERRILALRFFESKSQSEIAAEVGLSQMHVSRLLSATLKKLREAATEQQ